MCLSLYILFCSLYLSVFNHSSHTLSFPVYLCLFLKLLVSLFLSGCLCLYILCLCPFVHLSVCGFHLLSDFVSVYSPFSAPLVHHSLLFILPPPPPKKKKKKQKQKQKKNKQKTKTKKQQQTNKQKQNKKKKQNKTTTTTKKTKKKTHTDTQILSPPHLS